MKKLLFFIAVIPMLFWSCSGSVDVSNMNAEQYFNYALSLYNDEDYIESVKEFQAILLQFPGSAVSDDAQYYLAQSHYKKDEYILAAYEFSRLTKDMAASDFVAKAQYMLGESYYKLSPDYQLDQKYTRQSIEEFQAFIDLFPTDPQVPDAEAKIKELNDKLAEKEYNTARTYEKMQYFDAAIYYYNVVTETFHDSKYAPMAMFNKIKNQVKILDKKKNKENILKDMASFLEKYPDDPNTSEVKKMQELLSANI